jgi:hypothetical protein
VKRLRFSQIPEASIGLQLVAFRGTPRLTAGHLVDEATVTRLPLALAKRSQFDCVSAPPAGLEPATGRILRLGVPLIEDSISLRQVKSRKQQREALRRSRQPIYNPALVASAQ